MAYGAAWEEHKVDILRLYAHNTLEQVKELMKEKDPTFDPCIRSYREKIKSWGAKKQTLRQPTHAQTRSFDSGYATQSVRESWSTAGNEAHYPRDSWATSPSIASCDHMSQTPSVGFSSRSFASREYVAPTPRLSLVSDCGHPHTNATINNSFEYSSSSALSPVADSGRPQNNPLIVNSLKYDSPSASSPSHLPQHDPNGVAGHLLPSKSYSPSNGLSTYLHEQNLGLPQGPTPCFHSWAQDIAANLGLQECSLCGASKLHYLANLSAAIDMKSFCSLVEEHRDIVRLCDIYGNNCLHFAIHAGATLEKLQVLQNAGADMRAVNLKNQNILHLLNPQLFGESLSGLIHWAAHNGPDLIQRDCDGNTALHSLCQQNITLEALIRLIPYFGSVGKAINLLDRHGRRAIDYLKSNFAATRGSAHSGTLHMILVTQLPFLEHRNLKAGACNLALDVNRRLMESSLPTDTEVMDLLARAREKHLPPDETRRNALHYLGICSRYPDITNAHINPAVRLTLIEEYLQRGLDVNQYDIFGSTPLRCFLADDSINSLNDRYNQHEIARAIELLLRGGADPNLRDRRGETALYVACKQGRVPCVRVILKHLTRKYGPDSSPYFCQAFVNDGKRVIDETSAAMSPDEPETNRFRQQCIDLVRNTLGEDRPSSFYGAGQHINNLDDVSYSATPMISNSRTHASSPWLNRTPALPQSFT